MVTLSFCAVSMVIYLAFFLFPAILGFGYSFTSWNGISESVTFTGLANYREAFADSRFFSAIRNTLLVTLIQCVFFNLVMMVVSAMIERSRNRHVKSALRSLYFFPYIISYVVIAVIWSNMLSFRSGVVNQFLGLIGLEALAMDWLGEAGLVVYSLIGVNVWTFSGFYLVTYMSAIQTIPAELYESASLDGAGAVKSFLHVTVPMVMPALTVNLVVSMAWGLATFDPVLLLTKGGPGFASETVAYYIYWVGVLSARQGYGTAISFLLFVATMLVSCLQLKLLRGREVEA